MTQPATNKYISPRQPGYPNLSPTQQLFFLFLFSTSHGNPANHLISLTLTLPATLTLTLNPKTKPKPNPNTSPTQQFCLSHCKLL